MAALEADFCNILQHIKQEVQDGAPEEAHGGLLSAVSSVAAVAMKAAKRKYTRKVKTEPCENGGEAATAAVRKRVKKEPEDLAANDAANLKQQKITDHMPTVKKKRDRFKGLTEEEVLLRTLPDHLAVGLDILIVGINPGLTAAFVGHHYAGPGNHFWKCLYLSGLIPEPMNAYDDFKLLKYGIGFTNIVERTSRGSADLTRKEIKEGGEILKGKIQRFLPKIVVFNGKGIYEVFAGHKNFHFGRQPEPFPETKCAVYVVPSSSARCTQLPRAVDKVPFYVALKKLRDFLRGDTPSLEESEVTFPDLELKTAPKKVKTEPLEGTCGPVAALDGLSKPSSRLNGGRAAIKKEPLIGGESRFTPLQDKDLSSLLHGYAAAAAAAQQQQPLPRMKQEFHDLGGGETYGVMPQAAACSYGSVGPGMGYPVGYPVYAPYWNYVTMAAAAASGMVGNSVPRPAMTGSAGSSSPTASNVSSLTQASLESLPKADSKATVTNWLQSIPNHVDPLVD